MTIFGFPLLVIFILLVGLLVNAFACDMMIKAAKAKGQFLPTSKATNPGSIPLLWIIALLSPLGIIAVGLIVNALPDEELQTLTAANIPAVQAKSINDELPSI